MRTDDKGALGGAVGGGPRTSLRPGRGSAPKVWAGSSWPEGRPRTAHLAGTPAPSMRLNFLRHIRHFP